jgi:hypothetical protein
MRTSGHIGQMARDKGKHRPAWRNVGPPGRLFLGQEPGHPSSYLRAVTRGAKSAWSANRSVVATRASRIPGSENA